MTFALATSLSAVMLTTSVALPQDAPMPAMPPSAQDEFVPDWADEIDSEGIELLVDLLEARRQEAVALRKALAEAQLELAETKRELEELQQYVLDHDAYGDDFEQYEAIREIAEREDERKRRREALERREAERQERQERLQEMREARDQRTAGQDRIRAYERRGFVHRGDDVYTSRMAYSYKSIKVPDRDFIFTPGFGFDVYDIDEEIDFSEMTISGSVLNAGNDTRNIGIAITFFDEYGNQVGGETVQVRNARPNTPYPFTSKLDMALDRPFSSSSIYLLYADPIDASDTDQEQSDDSDGQPAGDGADDAPNGNMNHDGNMNRDAGNRKDGTR